MLKYVVIEDNANHKKNIRDIIVSFMMKNKLEFDIKEFDDYSLELLKYIKNKNEDTVYIIDLELPGGDGLAVARYIRDDCNDWTSPIIICTAHDSLAYTIYIQRLQVLDFISKCYNMEKNIRESLAICIKMLNRGRSYRYRYLNVDYNIPHDQINYIVRDGRKTQIVTKEENYFQNISINEIKKVFPNSFMLSSKGVLINMNNVDKIDWNEMKVYFKDKKSAYIVSNNHKKELLSYGRD